MKLAGLREASSRKTTNESEVRARRKLISKMPRVRCSKIDRCRQLDRSLHGRQTLHVNKLREDVLNGH